MEVEGAIVKGVVLLSPKLGISGTDLLPGRFFHFQQGVLYDTDYLQIRNSFYYRHIPEIVFPAFQHSLY